MENKAIELKLGEKVRVNCGDFESKRFNTTKKVVGKVVYVNKDYFTLYVENDGVPVYRESFMFRDRRIQIERSKKKESKYGEAV